MALYSHRDASMPTDTCMLHVRCMYCCTYTAHVLHVRTLLVLPRGRFMCSACMLHAHCVHTACTRHVQCMHAACTQPVRYIHSVSSLYAGFCLHATCMLHVSELYAATARAHAHTHCLRVLAVFNANKLTHAVRAVPKKVHSGTE